MQAPMARAAPRTDGSTTDALRTHLSSLARDRRNAIVTLERGPFPVRIVVRAGDVVDARVDGVRGERALLRALDAEQGRWRIDEDVSAPRGAGIGHISLDAVFARRDQLRELAVVVGGLEAIWGVRFRVLQRELPSIPDDVNPLLRLVDGKRTIGRVLLESPFEERLTVRVLHRLLTKGILVRPDEPDSVDDDVGSSPLADMLSRGLVPEPRATPKPTAPTAAESKPVRVREKEPRPLPAARSDDDDREAPADDGAEVALRAWSSKRVRPPSLVPMNGAAFEDEEVDDAAGLVVDDDPPSDDEAVSRLAAEAKAALETATAATVDTDDQPRGDPPAVDERTEEITEPQRAQLPAETQATHDGPLVDEGSESGETDGVTGHEDAASDLGPSAQPSVELSTWLDEEHAFFTRDARADEASLVTPAEDAAAIWRAVVVAISLFALVVLLTFALAGDDARPNEDAPPDRADVVEIPE